MSSPPLSRERWWTASSSPCFLRSSCQLWALGLRSSSASSAALLNIIPYFGPFFSMVPAFLVAFFSRGLLSASDRRAGAVSHSAAGQQFYLSAHRRPVRRPASALCSALSGGAGTFWRHRRHAAGRTGRRHHPDSHKKMGLPILGFRGPFGKTFHQRAAEDLHSIFKPLGRPHRKS